MESSSEIGEPRETRPGLGAVPNPEPAEAEGSPSATAAEFRPTDFESRPDGKTPETDKSACASENFSASIRPGHGLGGAAQGASCAESHSLPRSPELRDETQLQKCLTTEEEWRAREFAANAEAVSGHLAARLTGKFYFLRAYRPSRNPFGTSSQILLAQKSSNEKPVSCDCETEASRSS